MSALFLLGACGGGTAADAGGSGGAGGEGGEQPNLPPPCEEGELGVTTGWPEWTSFGLDATNNRYNATETEISATTAANLEIAWERIGPEITSTPLVKDGIVYVVDWAGWGLALGARTGCLVWARKISDAPITGTPVLVDDTFYVGDGAGMVHSFALSDGAPGWSVPVFEHPETFIFGSMVAAGDTLIVPVSSEESGLFLDEYTFKGNVAALDRTDGHELWQTFFTQDDASGGAGASVWGTPAVDPVRNLVFVGTGQQYEAPAGDLADSIHAIDIADGSIEWSRQFTTGDIYTIFADPPGEDADVGAPPLLFSLGAQDVVGVGDKAGVYTVLDRITGDVVWSKQLVPGSWLGGMQANAVEVDGVLFVAANVGDGDGDDNGTSRIFALEAATGCAVGGCGVGPEIWMREFDSRSLEPPRLELTFQSLSGANGVLYVATQGGAFRALDMADGAILFEDTDFGGRWLAGATSISNGFVYQSVGMKIVFTLSVSLSSTAGGFRVYHLP